MALVPLDLANKIQNKMGFPGAVSPELLSIATEMVTHMLSASVDFAAMTGEAPPAGGPLINGAGVGGVITLVASDLADGLKTALGHDTTEIEALGETLSEELAKGTCEFSSGTVTGTCTNTAQNPGAIAGGAGAT